MDFPGVLSSIASGLSQLKRSKIVLSCCLTKLLPTCVLFFGTKNFDRQFFTVHRALLYVLSGKIRQDSLSYGIIFFYFHDQTRSKDKIRAELSRLFGDI